jgi:hypothetical protein
LALSEKLRIELFLPDNPHPAYKALLATFQEEFTTTFGGCTVISNVEGQYRSEENQQTMTDRIQILFVDTNLQPALHQQAVEQYLHQMYETAYEALEEEAILISVYAVSHVTPPPFQQS